MCASQEIVHNEAIATTPHPSSTLPPLPPASSLFVASPSSPPPPPPAPRAVRRLTMENQEADSQSRRSLSPAAAVESPPPPSPERAASPSVGESPQPPDQDSTASPIAYCSQYRLMEHAQQNGPPPVSAAVGGWLRDAFGPSSQPPARYPTPPAAPRKDQYIPNSESECSDNCSRPRAPQAYLFRDGRLLFHKTYQGRQPFTFVDTRLYQGGRHDWYGVHNERDLLWARRLNLVLEHHNIPRRARSPETTPGPSGAAGNRRLRR